MGASSLAGGLGLGGLTYKQDKQIDAARDASEDQARYAEEGIMEQRRQFDAIVELLKPYVDVGAGSLDNLQEYAEPGLGAFGEQQALLGLLGPEAEREAIDSIREGEKFKVLQELGEESILNNAAVTRGLRGGRTQGALAEFSPALLQDLIDERYTRLGGITSLGYGTEDALARLGQASAAGQAAFGQQSATNVSNLFGDIGAAKAGFSLAKGAAKAGTVDDIFQLAGTAAGAYGGGGF